MSQASDLAGRRLPPRVWIEDTVSKPAASTDSSQAAQQLYDVLRTLQAKGVYDYVGWVRSVGGLADADIVVHLVPEQNKDDKGVVGPPRQPDDKIHIYVADGPKREIKGAAGLRDLRTWSWAVNVPGLWKDPGSFANDKVLEAMGAIKEAAAVLANNKIKSHALVRTVEQIKNYLKENNMTLMDALWGRNYRLVAARGGSFYGATDRPELLKERLADLRGQMPSLETVEKVLVDKHGPIV